MLLEAGPELARPLAGRVHHSQLSHLKELRPGSAASYITGDNLIISGGMGVHARP
jgi:hypothetical protein